MATVGHAYLKVMPSLEGLGRELRGEVQRAEQTAPPAQIKVRLDKHSVTRLPGQITRALAGLSSAGLASIGAQAGVGLLAGLASALATAGGSAGMLPSILAAAGVAAGTLRLGLSGIGDALAALREGDAAALAKALGTLAPAARAAVTEIAALGGGFSRLRLSVQESLFAGLAERVRDLGARYLPILTTGLSLVADGFNTAARGLADFLASAATQADVGDILLNVARAVQTIAPAAAPLAGVVRDLVAVGASVLPAFAAGAATAATELGRMVAAARESGQLENWISSGLAALGQLAGVLGNIARLVSGVVTAGQNVGSGLLGVIDEITGRLAEFVNSTAGQQALGAFFDSAMRLGTALVPVLTQVASIIGTVIAPAIADLGAALVNSDGLQTFLGGLRDGLAAIAPALPVIGQAIGAVATALAPLLGPLGQAIGALLTGLAQALITAAPLLQPVIAALGQLLAALVPLIPELTRIAQAWLEVNAVALPFVTFILRVLIAVIPAVVGVLRFLADAFTFAIGPVRAVSQAIDWLLHNPLTQLPVVAAAKIVEFVGWFRTLPPRVRETLAGLGDLLLQPGRDLVNGLRRGFEQAWAGFRDFVLGLGRGLIGQVQGIFGIRSPSRVFAEIGANLTAGLAQGVQRTAPLPVQAVNGMAAGVAGAAALPLPGLPPAPRLPTTPIPAAGRSITVNVHPQPGQSEAAIAAMVSRRLAYDARL
ncbi:phage tail protein [Saccharopolyspora hattusasensis]|uniref:phage tail protein n=1 Tax=Saccharopolyspora hattusasensis TaxID=1128679 RepID=UPI003D974B43